MAALLLLAASSGSTVACGQRDRSSSNRPAVDTSPAAARYEAADADVGKGGVASTGASPRGDTAAVLARFRARLPDSALVRRGACPFECCTYREWTAEGPIPVFAAERDSGAPALTIAPGQRFRADSGNVWVTGVQLVVVGAAIADRPYWSFAAGDTLVVLEPLGEGYYGVWHEGELRAVEGFWEPWRQPAVPARMIGSHRTEWWVHVTLPDGRAGWFEASPQVRFNGADACG